MNEEQLTEKLREKCKSIRKNLIEVISQNGGHLAPNLGVVELSVCLNEVFDFSKDIILFDVGHQSYVYKILTGRENKFETIRLKDGLTPFMDPEESEYDNFISGHAGTALPAAAGFATANPNKKVVVIVGDASILNGHSLEALNYIAFKKLENIIIILNDNEMSIGKNIGMLSRFLEKIILSSSYMSFRTEVRSLVDKIKAKKVKNILERLEISVKNFLMPLYSMENFGLNFLGKVDGHNISELLISLRKTKEAKGPTFLLVKTEKGKGYKFAEENKEKFHGISPFDISTGQVNKKEGSLLYSEIFGKKIFDLAGKDEDIFALSAGMIKGTCLDLFQEKYPDRCIDTGIAEGFLVTFAAGLAKSNKKPYVCIYSTFVQRAVSQLIHDISLQNLPVRFIIDRSGIVGQDGKTHNGMYDLSFFLSIENYTVLCPTTEKELKQCLDLSKDFSSPLVIRIPKDESFNLEKLNLKEEEFKLGKWKEIKKIEIKEDKKSNTIKKEVKNLFIATGSMLKEILEIENKLIEKGIRGTIVSAASVKPFDKEYLLNSIKGYDNIFILEETYMKNSFGTSILEFLNENGVKKIIYKLALNKAILSHGKRKEILEEEGLKGENLMKRIEGLIYGGEN